MASNEDEGALLWRAHRGDAAAFRDLALRHSQRLLGLARQITGDAVEAEDVVQEALLRLWRNAGTVVSTAMIGAEEGQDSDATAAQRIGGWLTQVTRNLAIDRRRKSKRLDLVDEIPEPTVDAALEPGPLRDLQTRDEQELIDNAMDELPERQRQALLLFHRYDLPVAGVAAALGVSEHAAESLLARGRRALKERIAKTLDGDFAG